MLPLGHALTCVKQTPDHVDRFHLSAKHCESVAESGLVAVTTQKHSVKLVQMMRRSGLT